MNEATLPWRRRHIERPAGFVSPRQRNVEQRVSFNRIRRVMAHALVESKRTAPHAYAAMVCDYTAIDEMRAARGARFRASEGFSLTYLPFVARSLCRALRAYPLLNATVVGDGLVVHSQFDLGIAVDLGYSGLVVPAVRDADCLTVVGLARAINDVAVRARAKRLSPDDVAAATFTITNPGGSGTFRSFPIINQPQVAILCTDAVHKTVVASDRYGIAVRPIGNLSVAFDHRAVDGAYVGAFLRSVIDFLECADWAAEL